MLLWRNQKLSENYHQMLLLNHLLVMITFCLANPGSITNTTPSIVRDVSAILVETTTFLPIAPLGLLGGGGSKILCCKFGGSVEYKGIHLRSPTSGPRFSTSLCILLQASSISCKYKKQCHQFIIGYQRITGPSCSKLVMPLVNVSLKIWSLNIAYTLIFLLKKCEYSHFFSKNTCELDIVLIRTVNILTINVLIKLTMLGTTGPWTIL